MTWRQSHFVQVGWIPSTHDDTTVLGIVLNLFNAFGKLVDALTRVVSVHVDILGAKVSPLKSVDWSQVTNLTMRQAPLVEKLARTISIPDMNILGSKIIAIGVSLPL